MSATLWVMNDGLPGSAINPAKRSSMPRYRSTAASGRALPFDVRHGHGPERQVQTGIGPVAVRRVRLRDRGAGETGERIRFTSAILPRGSRRTQSLDALLPILYLRGISMGDFQEALGALLGRDAPNPVTIGHRAAPRRMGGQIRQGGDLPGKGP
jgi:hypothetical protein